ncbi:MAG: LCP family protein [bacterium]|nr:LCP family protein [bacterium]
MDVNSPQLHTPVSPLSSERRRVWKKTLLFFIAAIALLVLTGVLIARRIAEVTNEPTFSVMRGLLLSDETELAGESEDRINVLLLGMGGVGHDGGYLTDTIILASVKPSTGDVALLSLPRDLSVPIGNGVWQKINSINAYAEAEDGGTGGETIRGVLANLFQINLPYYVRADFEGFKELVDAVGGLTVTVENTLDDPHYPVLGNENVYPYEDRFEHLFIPAGKKYMNGELALKYARSRYGKGGEGSDFARIKRQQNVLVALKDKVLSWPTLANPLRINKIVNGVEGHVDTNIPLQQLLRFAHLARSFEDPNLKRITLSDATDGLLVSRIIEGSYVLIPRDGNYSEIRRLTQQLFSDKTTTDEKNTAPQQIFSVEILNGTNISGLGHQIADLLRQQGFDVLSVGNAPERPVQQTQLYNLHPGTGADPERRIQQFLDALVHEKKSLPFITEVSAAKREADFVIILGENARIPNAE